MALDVLADALESRRTPAALAACEILQRVGHQGTLATGTSTSPSPLVKALDYGSPRLTHAAAQAISRIDSLESFPGSSRYIAALARLARSSGQRKALVGHVSPEVGRSIGTSLSQSGFTPIIVTRSREIFERAMADPDIELLVITDVVDQPDFAELLQSIRSSGPARQIPVALLVAPENQDRAMRIADRLPMVTVSPLVVDPSLIARQVDNTMPRNAGQRSSAEERGVFAQAAMEQLVRLAGNTERYPFYDIVNQEQIASYAIGTPGLTGDACRLLSYIGTPSAQRNLLAVANNNQLPGELRQVAAESFASAVESRGLLLKRDQIQAQYDLYNASADLPPETLQILGSILDTMEKRSK